MADRVVTGRKYRTKDANNNWNIFSFWTKSTDVEMNDGTILEDDMSELQTASESHSSDLAVLKRNNNANITTAPNYSETVKYVKGDIVKQNGVCYYCLVNMDTPESWDENHWNAISMIPFKFGIDDYGNYGYIKAGTDSVTPFKGSMQKILIASNVSGSGSVSESIISQKCNEFHINPSRLTTNNFVMELVSVSALGIYAYGSAQSNSTLSARSISYNANNSILTYQTGSWFLGGGQTTWVHGFAGGYDFFVDIWRRGDTNWHNLYETDQPGQKSIVTYSAAAVTAVCNIYLII